MNEHAEETMTIPELAKWLKVSESLINRMVARGVLPGFRMGTVHRFRKSDIEKWIDGQIKAGRKNQ